MAKEGFTKKLTRLLRRDSSEIPAQDTHEKEEPKKPFLDERIANMTLDELRDEYAGIKAQRDLLNDALAERDEEIEKLHGEVIQRSKSAISGFNKELQDLHTSLAGDSADPVAILEDIARFISQPPDAVKKKDIRFAKYQAIYNIMQGAIDNLTNKLSEQANNKSSAAGLENEVQIRSFVYTMFKKISRIVEVFPELEANLKSATDENANLRIENKKIRKKATKYATDLSFFRELSQLRDILKVIFLAAQTNEALRAYFEKIAPGIKSLAQHAGAQSTQDLYAQIYVGKFIELVQREKGWETSDNIAMREVHALSTKHTLLMNLLGKIAPESMQDLNAKLQDAEKADKERVKKGEDPAEYRRVLSEGIPATFADRTELDLIIQGLIAELKTHCSEDLRNALKGKSAGNEVAEAVVNLLSDTLKKQGSVAQYSREITDNLYTAVQQLFSADETSTAYEQDRQVLDEIAAEKKMGVKGKKLAEFIEKRLLAKADLYSLLALVKGTEPDKAKLAEDPVGYAAKAFEAFKQRLASAAQYTSAPSDPDVFVKQAYVHQMLGNVYSAEGKEDLANVQYEKARLLCENARSIASGDVLEKLETQITEITTQEGAENA